MIVANKYEILGVLGGGTYGKIYKVKNIRTQNLAALKMEPRDTKMLKNETRVYQYLSGLEGIPSVLWFGVDKDNYYMALPLLGSSLQSVRSFTNAFSLEAIILITKKMVNILECVHKKGLIHRDIKPDNFLFGNPDSFQIGSMDDIYLIDFGFCKNYRKGDNVTHIPIRYGRPLLGTPNFVSINIHNGVEPSRRDDLESVVYIMLFLYLDELPWTKSDSLREIKIATLSDEKIPEPIRRFYNYCRELGFDEMPNYNYIYELLNYKKIDIV